MDENLETPKAKAHGLIESPEQHRKNKRILIWVLLIFFILLAVLILRCVFCHHCEQAVEPPKVDSVKVEPPIEPVSAESTLDSTPVAQDAPVPEPEVVFSLDKLTPVNRPMEGESYVEDATKFETLYNAAVESAKANHSSELQLPESGVAFSLNSKEMHASGKALIKAYATAYLVTNRSRKIQVNGYTCNIGTPERNVKLGQARADVVVKLLKEYGVPGECITSKSYGETMYDKLPGVVGTEANRRVNLLIE